LEEAPKQLVSPSTRVRSRGRSRRGYIQTCWRTPLRKVLACAARLVDLTPRGDRPEQAHRCSWTRASRRRSTSSGVDPGKRHLQSGARGTASIGSNAGIARTFGEEADDRRSRRPLANSDNCVSKISKPDHPTANHASVRAPSKRGFVTVEDKEMRHGARASQNASTDTKTYCLRLGYGAHCRHAASPPPNRPELEAVRVYRGYRSQLRPHTIAQLSIDRGYINSPLAPRSCAWWRVLCKPWVLSQ